MAIANPFSRGACSVPALIQAAALAGALAVSSPASAAEITRMDQVQSFSNAAGTNEGKVELEAVVLVADPITGSAVLWDQSGAAQLGMDLHGKALKPGDRIQVSGAARVEYGRVTIAAPPFIVNPVIELRSYASNTLHLAEGYHSVEIGYVQGLTGKTLDIEYSTPGVSRRRVPASAWFHAVTNAAGSREYVSGVRFDYYEGFWNEPPLFAGMTPSQSGILPAPAVTNELWVRDFAVRFTGFIHVREAGEYTVYMRSDDAGHLFIGRENSGGRIQVVGTSPLPAPLPLRPAQGISREQAWRLAEMEGTVSFVGDEGGQLLLELTSDGIAQQARVIDASTIDSFPLLGCRVRARGVAAPAWTSDDQRVVGTLLIQDFSSLQLIEIPPQVWQETPLAFSNGDVTGANLEEGHMVQVRGTLFEVTEHGVVIDCNGIKVFSDYEQDMDVAIGTEVKAIGRLRKTAAAFHLDQSFSQPVAARAPVDPANLPVLTQGMQIYTLSAEEAARQYPVKIKGVVTSPFPLRIQDATRAAYISRGRLGGFRPAMGEIYEIEGVTSAGRFAPTIQLARATLKGPGVMPAPVHPTYDQLMSLTDCVQWAELEGVIQGSFLNSSLATTNNRRGDLVLATKGGVVLLSVAGGASEAWIRSLEDAQVRVRGTIAARFNDRRQNQGAYLWVPSPAYICVVKRGSPEPFSAPLQTIGDLMGFASRASLLQRVRIEGQVAHVTAGQAYVTDGTNGVLVRPRDSIALSIGDVVEIAGYQDMSIATPALQEAFVRVKGNRPLPGAELCNVEELFSSDWNLRRIRVAARILGIRTSNGERILDLQSGPRSFHARMDSSKEAIPAMPMGTIVEVTGVCAGRVVNTAHGLEMESFDILLNSPADLRVLKHPPRWTIRDALIVIAALVGFILLAVLWISLLRRRVENRTRQLRAEIENHKTTERRLHEEIEERKRIQQEVEQAHKELVRASRIAGMAEVATGVLHNVGNVLNTVNVSADIVSQRIQQSRLHGLNRLVQLLDQHNENIPKFLAEDPAGQMVPVYLRQLGQYFREEQDAQQQDLQLLRRSVDHIKEIVAMQQSYARSSALYEKITPIEAVEEAMRIQEGALSRHSVKVIREFETIAPFLIDKHKVLQILINLLTNAKYACDEREESGDKQVIVRVRKSGEDRVQIQVQDNGVGIAAENFERIFTQGFTTRRNGHGFGLHSSALAARDMGGSLSVHSDGKGCGATFTLEIPIRERIDGALQNGSAIESLSELQSDSVKN